MKYQKHFPILNPSSVTASVCKRSFLLKWPNFEYVSFTEEIDGSSDRVCSPADGRVFFTVSRLFEASICLRGGQKDDGWFFVQVEFLFNVGGDRTAMQGILFILLYSYLKPNI